MMTNLFSSFDPATSINYALNWFSVPMVLSYIPFMYWLLPNNHLSLYNKIMIYLFNEFSIIFDEKENNKFNLIFITLFIFLFLNNLMAMFPYIFAGTSHLTLNLTVALPLWFSLMLFGWMKKSYQMLSHLVPLGTPMLLIPFMVIIESLSLIMRPLTLTIRLTANMIAGHLLLTLLGNLGPTLDIIFIPLMISTHMVLLTLELAVSMIQSYVFSLLMTLYSSEI